MPLNRFVALVLAMVAIAPAARAQCDELPCSVIRNCSSTGIACKPDDRECVERARAKDLEIKCEQKCSDGPRFVYCPANAGRADESKAVRILLGLAGLLAVGGTIVAWLFLRKKTA